MQRKCNLSLYLNKKRVITRCLHCNSRLPDRPIQQLFCSDNCREHTRLPGYADEDDSLNRVKRRAEIRPEGDSDLELAGVDDDDAAWLERAVHWSKEVNPQFHTRPLARTGNLEQRPLIVTGHGVKLRIERNSLLVHNGFTHYPQTREEWRFFPTDPDLPSRIVLVETNGYISIDVLNWLSTQHIPLVVMTWQGEVSTICGVGPFDSDLRDAQLKAMESGRGSRLATNLIKSKIKASQKTLNSLPITSAVDGAIESLESNLTELKSPIRNVEQLMLIEAHAASTYFQAWRGIPIMWKGTKRHAIPPQWNTIGVRPSFFSGSNRHATHPVNSLMNYAYRALESQVLIAIISNGLDPAVGYLHSSRYRKNALVYDLMEPLRPQVDRSILRFVMTTTFTPKDFLLSQNGKCRLHPQLARRVVELNIADEIINDVVRKAITWLVEKV
jgi:CRISPR-associated protein Cas1